MSRRVDTVAKHLIESVVFISKAHVLNHYPLLLPLGLLSPLPIPVPPYPHPLPSTLCVRAVLNHLLLLPGKWIVKLKKKYLTIFSDKGQALPGEECSPSLTGHHNAGTYPAFRGLQPQFAIWPQLHRETSSENCHLSPSTPRTMRKKLNCCFKPQSTGKFVIQHKTTRILQLVV